MNQPTCDNAGSRRHTARRRCRGLLIALVALAATLPLRAAAAQDLFIDLRPNNPGDPSRRISGTIESIGPAGVVLRTAESPSPRRLVVSLDQLASMPPLGDAAPPDLFAMATDLWRARQRIERGDWQAAEPLLDALAPRLLPSGGPTAALVAEGLLTCRLARDARGTAMFAWLDWLRIMRAGPGSADASSTSLVAPAVVSAIFWEGGKLNQRVGASSVDRATGLVPTLPPIWVPGAATEAIAASAEWQRFASSTERDSTAQDPMAELAALFRAAADADSGRTPTLPARAAAFDGVALVRDVVTGRIGDPSARTAARESMLARIGAPETPMWIEAWCRAGIGRSLVVEPEADARRRGVLQLLHLPARFGRSQRHLAAIALAEAATTLARDGDASSASVLRSELARTFGDHPAMLWAEEVAAGLAPPSTSASPVSSASLDGLVSLQSMDTEVESLVPIGPEDALEAYLVRVGLPVLLAEHLELRLASLQRDQRTPVAERLAKLYVRLLEAASDADSRGRWEQKADALLREVPEAEGHELRISLSRVLYVRAEDICERSRLRLATGDEIAEAERVLRQLEPRLREIASKVHRRVDTLERIEKQGDATDELNRQLADARRVRSLAFYYSGWCSYYLTMLTRSEPAAIEAFKSFGWLLNSPGGRAATLDRVPISLLRYEHVARAAMGCALAASARGNDVEAMVWLETVEAAPELSDPVKAQLLLRKIGILGAGKRWSDLERTIRIARNSDRAGAGQNVRPLRTNEARLLAIVTLEADRTVAAGTIDSLSRLALGDLIARGEIAHVLDLVDKFGTAPIGETGFVVHYVRAVKSYDEARAAHRAAGDDPEEPATIDSVVNLYRAASGLLSATLSQPDAQQYKPERVRAAMFAARASFYAADFARAADGFIQAWEIAAADNRASPEAEETLWLAVVALDRATSLPASPSPELVRRRTETGALFLQSFPESSRAARLLLMRAATGDVSDDEAMRVLEGVPKDSPMYEAARRQVARILYTRFRSASGTSRDFAAMRFITVAEELLAIDRRAATQVSGKDTEAASRAIVRARQLLDALLGVTTPDADRAQSTLELLRTLASVTGVSIAEHEAELLYRELQIAIARGRDDLAALAVQQLMDLPSAQREYAPAAERLLYRRAATLFRQAASEHERLEAARNTVEFGVRVIDRMGGTAAGDSGAGGQLLGVQSVVAEAAFALWRASGGTEAAGGDEAMRDLSLRLDKLVLKVAPNTADSLRRSAVTSEAAADPRGALESWSVLLAAAASGSLEWFEARYHALRLIARLEPARAKELLAQHKALFPTYGPAPWGDRIRELDDSMPAANPAAPPSSETPGAL